LSVERVAGDPLGELDDQPCRAADVARPVTPRPSAASPNLAGMELRDPHAITSPHELWSLVGEPNEKVIAKERADLDERSRAFIASAPFLVLATYGADGSADVSPKGGPPGFVVVRSDTRLAIPEFPGNRRIDGLHNLVERSGIAILFIVPGITETLRVNGDASVTRDPDLLEATAVDGKRPWFVVDVQIHQVFSHCSKAFLRSHLWQPETWPDPDRVTSPSRTIAERAVTERRSESAVRRAVEQEYEPGLY
jgi:PPOX class probable FMN-dependent enzyme